MSQPPTILTHDLRKVYATDEVETTALNGVSLSIGSGEFVAIMGPSGCGKSTLLNLMGLLDQPTDGSYKLAGQEAAGLAERKRAEMRRGTIGFVFQSFNLIDDLTVYENVELPLLYLKASKEERKARTEAALDRVGMAHRRDHFPQQLSGGQQQRVAVARAVVAGPQLLLADEPTGNLDSKNGQAVMDLLAELNAAGTTIVMVTHSAADAEYAQRIVNLFDGRVVSEHALAHEYHLPDPSSKGATPEEAASEPAA
ncbi:MAG: ABC transporter ATP-binding protein [Rubricoccaceae bacterium]